MCRFQDGKRGTKFQDNRTVSQFAKYVADETGQVAIFDAKGKLKRFEKKE
jgi:hypothetical protein